VHLDFTSVPFGSRWGAIVGSGFRDGFLDLMFLMCAVLVFEITVIFTVWSDSISELIGRRRAQRFSSDRTSVQVSFARFKY
jgi:hypothetical protein